MSLLFLISLNVSSQQPEKIKLKGVLMENDYHEKISWVKSKPIPLVSKDFSVSALNVKYIQLYFGLKVVDGKQVVLPLRLINNYKDQDWIFFDEISYLVGSRKKIRVGNGKIFKMRDDDTSRSVSRGVKEYSDVEVNGELESFIKHVIESDDTGLQIRYLNSKDNDARDITVPSGTKKIKKHFKALIDSYNRLLKAYGYDVRF